MSAAPFALPPGATLESAPPVNAGGMRLPPGATLESAPAQQPSAISRFKDNFLSGLGIGSKEDAKNFFEHPLNTLMGSVQGQADLYQKAKDAYDRGDYKGAVIHGLNYLVPFIGQQTDKAGEQLQQGDIAGGMGRTLGVAAPIIAGSPEARGVASDAASTVKNVAVSRMKPALTKVGSAATAVGDSLDPDIVGLVSPRAAHALRLAAKTGKVATKLGAPSVPEAASAAEETTAAPVWRDATRQNVPYAGEEEAAEPPATAQAAQAQPAQPAPATPAPNFPKPDTSPKAIENLLNEATGGKPLKPGVSLRNQATAATSKTSLPQDFTPVESSVLKGYKYDPNAQTLTSITNNGQMYKHSGITPDMMAAFEEAKSKGQAWNMIRNGPGVSLIEKNGKPIVKSSYRSATPEDAAPGEEAAGPASSQPASTPAASPKTPSAAEPSGDDLTSLLQQSLENVNLKKNGYVQTTADPAQLSERWGVDESSLASGREQTRGMSPEETEQYVQKLAERYKQGFPVEPVMETRDAENNIIEVDGRARAIAAQRAGVKRIPIIVRRMPKPTPVQ